MGLFKNLFSFLGFGKQQQAEDESSITLPSGSPSSPPGREGGGGSPEDVYHAAGEMLAGQDADIPAFDDVSGEGLSSIPAEPEPALPAQEGPTPKELRLEAGARARERFERGQKRLGRFKPPEEIKHSPRAVGEAARAHQQARREETEWDAEKAPRQRPFQAPSPAQLAEHGLAESDVTQVPDEDGLRFDRVPSSTPTPPGETPKLPKSAQEISVEEAARLESGRETAEAQPRPRQRASTDAGHDRTVEMLERLLGKVDMLGSGLQAIHGRLAELENTVREMGTLG